MNPFGKNLNIKKRNPEYTEKEVFLDIILTIDECWKRTHHMEEEMEIGISSYEEPFYLVIENLVFLHYGEWKGHIILWWLFERFDSEGELLPITLNDDDLQTSEDILIKDPEELWAVIRKIELK
jgi:hypothetical protein